MISKVVLRNTLLLLLAFLQFSCSEFLKGKPNKDDTINVSKQSVNCVSEVSEKWETFLQSSANEKEIDKAFECIDQTMNEFQTRVEGKADANSFTTEEMQKIFDKFMKGSKITPEATKDLMVLKAAILGGSTEKVTKSEIADLRQYMELIKAETKALMPYVSLFKFKKESSPFSKKMLQDGFGQLNLSLKNLFRASKFSHSEYQFSDLQKLIENLKVLDQEQSSLMTTASKVKNLLGGNQALQSEADYATFIDNLTEVLRLYSFHLQGYVKFAIEKPELLNDSVAYIESWIGLLENSLQFKRFKTISVETLDPLIAEVSARGILPIDVKIETLLPFYKVLIVRAFDAGVQADVAAFTGLSKAHFIGMRREMAVFKLYLQMLSSIDGSQKVNFSQAQEQARLFDIKKATWLNSYDQSLQRSITSAFEELKAEFLSEKPIQYRLNKMVVSQLKQDLLEQSWQDLVRALYVKMLARELMIGWGTSGSKMMNQAYLTEAQLIQWYSDFKQFGIEVKAFDPRSANSGGVSFKQANLLTYSADGNELMNFAETTQFLSMLTSGGGQMTSEIQRGFEEAKCQLDEKDVFGNYWVDEKCALTNLRQSYRKYFSNLPTLNAYLSQTSEEQFYPFFIQALEVSRVNPQLAGQKLETADLRNLSILLHSVESLFLAFDKDKNWHLSADEVRAAFPRFRHLAQKYAKDRAKEQIKAFNGRLSQTIGGNGCFSEEDLMRESFVFMVFNGSMPKSSDLRNVPCFTFRDLIKFDGEVGRQKMINTFKILKSVLGS